MAFDIVVRDRIQSSIERKLATIETRARGATQALRTMRSLMSNLNLNLGIGSANRSFGALHSNLRRVNTQIGNLNTGFVKATNGIRRLISAALLIQGAESFVGGLDAFQNLQNRLLDISKVVNSDGLIDAAKSQERLNELTRQMFEIADKARVPVSSLATTYRRLDNALKSVGASQQESMRVTETAGKLLSLSGANANEASSALLQLSQAFNKGKLDGDEFRSIAELMPQTIDAISNRLGIARSEIFKYSKDGKITIDILRGAFKDLADQVDADFERLPRTVGQAFTQLFNEITKFFGTSGNGRGFLDSLISGIDWIKENLPTVVQIMKAFVAVMAAEAITGFVANLFSIQGAVNGLLQIVPAAIAYFTYFSDQISVTSDGVVKLSDVFVAFYEVIKSSLSDGNTFLGSIFSAEGAQKAFDFVLDILGRIQTGIIALTSAFGGIFDVFMALDWHEIPLLISEALVAVNAYLGNAIISFFQLVLREGGRVIDILRDKLIGLLQDIANIGIVLGASLSSYIGGGSNGAISNFFRQISTTLESYKGAKVDFGITDALEKAKLNIGNLTPTIQKASGIWKSSFTESFNATESALKDFYNSVLDIARKNANDRIAEEKRVQDVMRVNPNSLRGAGGSSAATGRKRLTIVGNNPTSDLPIQVFGLLKRKYEERKKILGETATVVDKINQSLQKTTTIPDSFEERKTSTEGFKTDLASTITTLEAVNNSVSKLNLAVSALSFAGAKNSVINYGISAVEVLGQIGDLSVTTGDRIAASQIFAWAEATAAVENYAAKAIASLSRVSEAAQRIDLGVGDIGAVGGGARGDGNIIGFASGGYTGNGGRNRIAGVVHGQEYVMPADATAKYRPLLDAMRSGQSVGTQGTVNVTIENYGSSTHTVQQISPTEVRIIARDVVSQEVPRIMGQQLNNPNSGVSKSIRSNLQSKRRR